MGSSGEEIPVRGDPTPPTIDGTISGSEYEDQWSSEDEGKFDLYWTTIGTDIYIGMTAPVNGWICFGLDPTNDMTNADMIIAWVSGGTPHIKDTFCLDEKGNHPDDTTFTGGSYDIDSFDGTESGGRTTFEFKRAMATGDPYDKAFINGTAINVMWATSNTDSNDEHDDQGYGTITMDGVPPPPPPVSKDMDGIVTEGEYTNSTSFPGGTFILYWKIVGSDIIIAMKAQTTGWISLGISPENRMQGADIIIGGFSGPKPYCEDNYAGTQTSHQKDTLLGGTDDILGFNATESGGSTTLEVKRAISASDTKDKPIKIGIPAMKVIWGYGDSDDISSVHTAMGSGTWKVENGSSPPPPPPPPPSAFFDGVVSTGEYRNSTKSSDNKFELFWNLGTTSIDIAIRAQVTGYISLGIDPTLQMENADMIFGWVVGGMAKCEDHFGTGTTTHMNDLDLDGTFDISSFNGTEAEGWTTLEFRRNLTTDDIYDKTIRKDSAMTVIWAISNSDDTAATHTGVDRGSFSWDLSGSPPPPPPPPPPEHFSEFDGIVTYGEYTGIKKFDSDRIELYWNVTGTTVNLGIKAQTTGWISLGIDATNMMEGGDYVIGGFDGERPYAEDHYGNTGTTHAKDTALGGKDDIIDYNATENGVWTTLELKRNLSASDAYDKPILSNGLMNVIWAYSSSDDPTAKHTKTLSGVWNTSQSTPPPPPPPPPKNTTLDGIVKSGEYDDSASFGNGKFVIHWSVNGTRIWMAMVAQTTGWLSIGFEPTSAMKDADMVFGWVENGLPKIEDHFGTGMTTHVLDTDLGGTFDIITYNGTETGGSTTIEFIRDLDTKDSKDKPIPAKGAIDIIWAIGGDDDPTSTHTERGSGTLLLYPDKPKPSEGLDGKISMGEYKDSATFDFDKFRIFWTIKDGDITMAISAMTTGWISIGFDPEDQMLNSDVILGWVEMGKVHIVDAFSTGKLGPHPPDTHLGGTTDIHQFNGTEIDGITTIEFVRKLSTGDQYDKVIPTDGTMKIMWAYGISDDFGETHSQRGFAVLTIGPGNGNGNGNKPDLDGIIAAGEYSFNGSFADGLITYHWKVEGDSIRFAMVGKTTGWVSIGIGYTKAMANSDMIFGWVDQSGTVHVEDTYSTGETGPHPRDTEQGGTNDITSFGGKEINGITTIEFVRKLDTGDSKDNPIPKNGTLKIIWGIGPSDSLDGMHNKAGYGTINIESGETTSEDPVVLWPFHALFMTLGAAGMITAWVAQRRKKWKPFMKYHMWVMIGSVTSGAVGLVLGYIMVEEGTGIHLRVLHSWLGVVAILVAFAALGMALFFKYTKIIKAKRPTLVVHRHTGRSGVVLFFGVTALGIFQALILSKHTMDPWLIAANALIVLALAGIIIYMIVMGRPKPAPPKPVPPPAPPAAKPAETKDDKQAAPAAPAASPATSEADPPKKDAEKTASPN